MSTILQSYPGADRLPWRRARDSLDDAELDKVLGAMAEPGARREPRVYAFTRSMLLFERSATAVFMPSWAARIAAQLGLER